MVHDEFKTLEEEEGKAKKNTILSVLLLIFSFFGFLDTLYLSVKEILASPVSCFIFQGCSQVLGSSYSKIFGLPLSFYGLIFYLAIFVLTIRYLESKKEKIIKWIFGLSILGILCAVYFLILQFAVIRAECVYCLFSVFNSTIIFVVSFVGFKRK